MTFLAGTEIPPARVEADVLGAQAERSLRETAEDLLSVADSVTREGWGDTVAAHLRQAAYDLLRLTHPFAHPGKLAG